jgi:anti-anti-sigma factor
MLNQLETRLRDAPPLVVIDLRGEITTFAQEPLMIAYREAAARGVEGILLNFSAVEYLNSAGLAAIISIISQARQANQRLMLMGLTPHYRLIFDMMGLTTYAPVFDTEDAARESVRA